MLSVFGKHYEDLIHNRIPMIAKSLACPTAEIHRAITHEIAHLDLHPGFNQRAAITVKLFKRLSQMS